MVAVTMLICLILPIHYDSISPYHCKILNSLSHPFVSHIHHVSNLNSISSRKCSFTICELVRIRYITLNACQLCMVFHRLQKTEAWITRYQLPYDHQRHHLIGRVIITAIVEHNLAAAASIDKVAFTINNSLCILVLA